MEAPQKRPGTAADGCAGRWRFFIDTHPSTCCRIAWRTEQVHMRFQKCSSRQPTQPHAGAPAVHFEHMRFGYNRSNPRSERKPHAAQDPVPSIVCIRPFAGGSRLPAVRQPRAHGRGRGGVRRRGNGHRICRQPASNAVRPRLHRPRQLGLLGRRDDRQLRRRHRRRCRRRRRGGDGPGPWKRRVHRGQAGRPVHRVPHRVHGRGRLAGHGPRKRHRPHLVRRRAQHGTRHLQRRLPGVRALLPPGDARHVRGVRRQAGRRHRTSPTPTSLPHSSATSPRKPSAPSYSPGSRRVRSTSSDSSRTIWGTARTKATGATTSPPVLSPPMPSAGA